MSALFQIFNSKFFSYGAVVAGNSMAFLGVILWDWDLYNIFYLYWLENVVIGVVTLVRMLLQGASFGVLSLIGTLFIAAFFTVHYGMFTVVHGGLMTEIFYDNPMGLEIDFYSLLMLPFTVGVKGFIWVFAGILLVELVHGLRQIGDDRSQQRIPQQIMFSPYGRIVVLHMTILLGAGAMQVFGVSMAALVVFVVFKTIYDLGIMNFVDQKKEKEA